MNTKELMIGDLVMVDIDFDSENIHIHGVRRVTEVFEEYVSIEGLGVFSVGTEDCSPIRLLANALLKNGFRRVNYGSMILEDKNKKPIFHLDYFFGSYCVTMNNYNTIKVIYVHELQHVLRLCGLNEVANNFTM